MQRRVRFFSRFLATPISAERNGAESHARKSRHPETSEINSIQLAMPLDIFVVHLVKYLRFSKDRFIPFGIGCLLCMCVCLPQVVNAVARIPSTKLVCDPSQYPQTDPSCVPVDQGASLCASFAENFAPASVCYSTSWDASIARCEVTCDWTPYPGGIPEPPYVGQ